MEHIATYGSNHTDVIVTENYSDAMRFQREVDSGVVMINASTMFCDGETLGMGAEIGISTDKLHARGPMGLRELTTYKFAISGDGQVMGDPRLVRRRGRGRRLMERLHQYFLDGFNQALSRRDSGQRRIGAELKFPLVDADGRAASRQKVEALWAYPGRPGLGAGYTTAVAGRGGGRVQARTPEPQRGLLGDRVLQDRVLPGPRGRPVRAARAALAELTDELREFSNAEEVYFLGYGYPAGHPAG